MTITPKRGIELLQDPSLNKSTAFTEAEKQALGIVGLVPDVTETEDLQLRRVMMQLAQKNTDFERYIYLINLLDHDETLFYRTIMSDPARFLPIVYDPAIGEACLKFGHIYRQARGMYLSITRRGKVKGILKNWRRKMFGSSASLTAAGSSAWVTSAQTARASPSANCSSTRPPPACRRSTCCPGTSTRALTTSST